MTTARTFPIIIATTILLVSCSLWKDSEDIAELRVQNATEWHLNEVSVRIFGPDSATGYHQPLELTYHNLGAGEKTDYQPFPDNHLYISSFLSFKSDFGALTFPPIRQSFSDDRYTYLIKIVTFDALTLDNRLEELNELDSSIEIRIQNNSDHFFESVEVLFPGDSTYSTTVTAHYGAVPASEVTAYRELELAYRYAPATVVTASDTLQIKPQDFTGEMFLEPGRYTYVFDIEEGKGFTTEIIRD